MPHGKLPYRAAAYCHSYHLYPYEDQNPYENQNPYEEQDPPPEPVRPNPPAMPKHGSGYKLRCQNRPLNAPPYRVPSESGYPVTDGIFH